jgi:hypothetical protein
MNPLGFYGLDLDISVETEIDNLHLHELTDLTEDMANALNNKHFIDNDEAPHINDESKPVFPDQLSDVEKIGLIRGLCDRIDWNWNPFERIFSQRDSSSIKAFLTSTHDSYRRPWGKNLHASDIA